MGLGSNMQIVDAKFMSDLWAWVFNLLKMVSPLLMIVVAVAIVFMMIMLVKAIFFGGEHDYRTKSGHISDQEEKKRRGDW